MAVNEYRRRFRSQVNITVINDANEGGVNFSRSEYSVEVSESARAGESLVTLQAAAGSGARLLYGLSAARAPAHASLFRLNELTGALELARALDRYGPTEATPAAATRR